MADKKGDKGPRAAPRFSRPLRWSIFLLLIALTVANVYFHFRRNILQKALPVITIKLAEYVRDQMGAELNWGDVNVDQWGRIVFEDLTLILTDDPQPVLTVGQATVTIAEKGLLTGKVKPVAAVRSISVKDIYLKVSRDEEGMLNLASLFPSERPFDPATFALKPRLRISTATVEYSDPSLIKSPDGQLRFIKLRGGIDFRDFSDIRAGLLFDVSDISNRTFSVKGRADLFKETAEYSAAGGVDIAKAVGLTGDEPSITELEGDAKFGITASGSYNKEDFSLYPEGVINLKGVGLKYRKFDEKITDAAGALHFTTAKGDKGIDINAYAEKAAFNYGATKGQADVRAGWDGRFAYEADVDFQGFDVLSVKSLIPSYVRDKLGFSGKVDLSLSLYGGTGTPSIRAEFKPSPQVEVLGLDYTSGVGRFALNDKQVLIDDISIQNPDGRSLSFSGYIDFRADKPVYRLSCSFEKIPAITASVFYLPAGDWVIAGDINGMISYTPQGSGHGLNLKIYSQYIQTPWGETGRATAAMRTSPGHFTLEGLTAEAAGGWLSAASSDDGKIKFALSDADPAQIPQIMEYGDSFVADRVNCNGIIGTKDGASDIEFAVENPTLLGLDLYSLTGDASLGQDSLKLKGIKAVGEGGMLIDMDGDFPSGGSDINLAVSVTNFDFASLFPEREGPPISRTSAKINITGPPDSLNLDASVTEEYLNFLGNMAFSCTPQSGPDTDKSPPGEIKITGKMKFGDASSGGGILERLSASEFTGLKVKGAMCIGPHPTGLPSPADYRNLLGGAELANTSRNNNGGIKLVGVANLDGNFDGPLTGLDGGLTISSPTLKLGLRGIRDVRFRLLAARGASFALDGEWKYAAGGSIAVQGPAGWDSVTGKAVIDLTLDADSAPIVDFLSLAGVDVGNYATGAFDGSGRISGPIGDLALSGFEVNTNEGASLLGMTLAEGKISFALQNSVLDLNEFLISSNPRPDGGHTVISGSGSLYIEEKAILPQAQITASIKDYRLEDLSKVFDVDLPLTGRLDADINVIDQDNRWNLSYALRLAELTYKKNPLPNIEADLVFDRRKGRLLVDRLYSVDAAGGWLNANGRVTLGALNALFDKEARRTLKYETLDIRVTGSNYDLGFIKGFLPPEVGFQGKLASVDLAFSGKLVNPEINGTLLPDIGPVSFGDFILADRITTHSGQGLRWKDGIMDAAGDLYIAHGDAVANLEGAIDLRPFNPLTRFDPRYTAPTDNWLTVTMADDKPMLLEATGFQFSVIPEDFKVGISGGRKELETGWVPRGEVDLSGKLNIVSGSLDAFEIKFDSQNPSEMPVNYNITVNLAEGLRLRGGKMLDTTLKTGVVNLSGTPLSPKLSGHVEISGGELNVLSRTFTFLPGSEVSFSPLFGFNPFLRAEAEVVITQHPKAEAGGEPLIIDAKIESFLSDIERGLHFTSNYSYTSDELLAIIGYENILQTLEEEGLSSAFTSSLYMYPSGLISRYMRDLAGFNRFDLTVMPNENVTIDVEKEAFIDNLFFTYNQTFGDGVNFTWGAKYRFRPRSYAGIRFEDLETRSREEWIYFVEYLWPLG